MEDLLPYYERELGFLRKYSREFAENYPKIAGRLLLSGDGSQDPHVERLIECFALLSARVSKKIDDDYPEFTESLLEVLYPHYLRPFPSCSIAQFDVGPGLAKMTSTVRIPRGSMLQSRPVRGVACQFRTAYDVTIVPLKLAAARYQQIADAPSAVALPASSGGQISLSFEAYGDEAAIRQSTSGKLRMFVDGEPSFRALLRDAIGFGVIAAYVEPDNGGRWHPLPLQALSSVGFRDDESLIDFPARSHVAYRLLTELFTFPDKFGFFDLDLGLLPVPASANFRVHLILRGSGGDWAAGRMLESLRAEHIRLGCTPVVNLFAMNGEPIRVSHQVPSYPVVADARRAFAYEVYSIDSVRRIRQTPQGDQIDEFRPFYSLRHGEDPSGNGQYWLARRDEDVARHSPGYETELSFVDLDFKPALPQTEVVSLQLTCTNRDLPSQLAYGISGGDLTFEGGSQVRTIALLRKPTAAQRFARGRGAQWRLISHLSLNTLSLTQGGLSALKEMLQLYDLTRSTVTARQIEAIVAVGHEPVNAWISGKHFPSVVRGVNIRLTLDETGFVGTGVAAFIGVLDRFLSLYVHANSFTQLVVISHATGEVIVECPARSGESILV